MIVSQKYQDLLQPNSHNRFSKISRTFYASRKLWISMHAERKITNLSDWHSFTPHSSLSPYSQTELWRNRQNYRETDKNTKEQIHLLRVGWRNFFSSCAVASVFWLWREIVLGATYLPYQLCRCVFFLIAAGISFGLHRSVFDCGGK